MIYATVVNVYKNLNNIVYKYKVQDKQWNIRDFTPEQLKLARDGRTFESLYKLVRNHKNYTSKLILLKNLSLSNQKTKK